MNRSNALLNIKRANIVLTALAMLAASALPILTNNSAKAAQITERSIAISSSNVSETSVTYDVSFIPVAGTQIEGLVVELCQDSPLIGDECVKTNGASNTPTVGSVNVVEDPDNDGSGTVTVSYDYNAPAGARDGLIVLTPNGGAATGLTPTGTDDVTVSFTADNPTGTSASAGTPGTFYGRIITFSTIADAQAYNSAVANSGTNPGNNVIDEGGTAMSTADQLVVSARVQEELEFCVGSITAANITANTDGSAGDGTCSTSAISGSDTAIDLGIVSNGSVSASPVGNATDGDNETGAMIIQTNAANGATISYFAEQDSGTEQLGTLRKSNAACNATVTNETDDCFEYSATGINLGAAGEGFGARVNSIADTSDAAGGTTGNLTSSTNYDGANFSWQGDGNVIAEIASSVDVLDYTLLEFQFGARASATTPTGTYSVTSTYIATASY